jgi:hypothetical protein
MKLNYGDSVARTVSGRIAEPVATLAALKAIPAENRVHGMEILLSLAGSISRWWFHSTSEVTGDDQLVISPTAGSGKWLRLPGAARLVFPITSATADAAVLYTVPTGALLNVRELFWTISVNFSGGSSSAIGVSSTKTNFTTKGDLLGGAGGDVAATLAAAASPAMGTIGAGFDTLAKRRVLWKATEIFRFDRVVSAYTAGTGAVNVICDVLQNDGA